MENLYERQNALDIEIVDDEESTTKLLCWEIPSNRVDTAVKFGCGCLVAAAVGCPLILAGVHPSAIVGFIAKNI